MKARSFFQVFLATACILPLLGSARPAQAGKKLVVAFFGIRDKGFVFGDEVLDRLDKAVETVLGEDGIQVIPPGKVGDQVGKRRCKDVKCLKELGKVFAAEQALEIKIVRSGTVCGVVETLLGTGGRGRVTARMHETACEEKAVHDVLRETVPRLVFEVTGWTGASAKTGDLPVRLSEDRIDRVFGKHAGAIERCIHDQHQRDPEVKGVLRLSYVIQPSGIVGRILVLSQEHRDTFIVECITHEMKQMRFPPFSGDTMTGLKREFRLGG
ncbi:MAG: AgmX/PglI C-terminal domain-containing protein [Deltaproteobacteria bacterium]|nr:AgmX/PglI C-terminal domain-containing protein [Deltaproteobacteria bacterium]